MVRRLQISVKSVSERLKGIYRHGPDKYARFLRELTSLIGPIGGKKVLEIGSDASASLLRAIAELGAAEVTGVNPALTETSQKGKVRLIKGDARSLPLPDSSVDIVVSISVLEHVRNLDEVIEEAYRVLRPRGYFYAEFGPIWSAVWGHHLWLYHGGDVVDWRTHALPPYAHLLMSPAELREWCVMRFDDLELASKITDFVFHSPDQNRMFYSDYQEVVARSKFEILLLTGCPDIPAEASYGTPVSEHLALLRERYPDKTGFGYHVGRLLLKKP
jgi:ubiquinone/menaquinone biosynthesis C-methylase UbiE